MSCREPTSTMTMTMSNRQATMALELVMSQECITRPMARSAEAPPSLACRLNAVRSTTPVAQNAAASRPALA